MVINSSQPTHAGGVVYRIENGRPEILVLTARRRSDEWVFPKGHIEAGETSEQTAVREVREESGVSATIIAPLEDVQIQMPTETQTVRYFLMRARDTGTPGEGRQSLWLTADEALNRLTFDTSRGSLRKALDLIRSGYPPSLAGS